MSATDRQYASRCATTACLILLLGGPTSVPAPAQATTHERRVTLTGATNLRDLGGYATADGRRVRWGLVYRSDQLAQLTDQDYEHLTRLGISAVCDLRREDERQRAPTHWRGSDPPEMLVRPPAAPGQAAADPVGVAVGGGTGEQVAATMRASYAQNVTALAPTYGAVFDRILQGRAVLVHSTAGKDRTGIFSALFLTLVGVPADTVERDYLLSNTFYGTDARVAAMARGLKTSLDAARALLTVDKSYLQAALLEIDAKYGSLDGYRRTMLGMSDAALTDLRRRVLEP